MAKCLKKWPKNDITKNLQILKNCLKMWQFGQNKCCHRLRKVSQSDINCSIWSHWFCPKGSNRDSRNPPFHEHSSSDSLDFFFKWANPASFLLIFVFFHLPQLTKFMKWYASASWRVGQNFGLPIHCSIVASVYFFNSFLFRPNFLASISVHFWNFQIGKSLFGRPKPVWSDGYIIYSIFGY